MSTKVDLSQFFGMFFDEAGELLAEMERLLLALDLAAPDPEDLDAIFRAAHSIKGSAGTFGCFEELAHTTHAMESQMDLVRHGALALSQEMVDLFLETKDVMAAQVEAYRQSATPDADAYARICARLKALGDGTGATPAGASAPAKAKGAAKPKAKDKSKSKPQVEAAGEPAKAAELPLCVRITRIRDQDVEPLAGEMAILGEVLHREQADGNLSLWMRTTADAGDIEAVCCFVVNADQVSIGPEALPASAVDAIAPSAAALPDADADAATASGGAGVAGDADTAPPAAAGAHAVTPSATASVPAPAPNAADGGGAAPGAQAAKDAPAAQADAAPVRGAEGDGVNGAHPHAKADAKAKDAATIRVGVGKVDQIINLVGELVITQAMLVQAGQKLDPVLHDRLLGGIEQLERNARDLQEAVMSIRMMPMDYVFGRFPRLVREDARRLGKRVRLVTVGHATELDKSLIERIIDPLTHLVRNSLDHGIETPEVRARQGKDPEGTITLSAQHSGGQVVIEVSDDGAGLDHAHILKKALGLGFPVSDATPDDELWQLIFVPGFSTSEKVTDISGRGVGMDVVRRNIQGMGGYVQLSSRAGQGTTTRIVLPLTLAILDGMSVHVGGETFILPLGNVTESMQPTATQIHRISEREQLLFVRGEYLPIVALHRVFSVAGAETDPTRAIAVILEVEKTRFALLVDGLIGQHQVVVKSLESNYRRVPAISAATILGDGSVALIVDVFALRPAAAQPVTA